MKSYELKVYDRLGNFKQQINQRSITSEVSFQEELDGGQGDLTVKIVGDLGDYSESDIIEIREVDDENFSVTETYSGIIEEIDITEYQNSTVLEIRLLGIFTALNDVIYKSGASRTFSKSMTAGNMVKDILASFNADYGALAGGTQNLSTTLIREGSIDVSGATLNIDFDNDSCISAIKKVLDGTGLHFYIGADGYLHVFTTRSAKVMTLGNEILQIKRKRHKREMVNTLYLERTGGVEQTYSDAVSVATYGKKERKDVQSDIRDITTQNAKGNGTIADFSNPRNEIEIKAKRAQSNTITPGMPLTVQNTSLAITSQTITKIQKGIDWTIYVGDFVSFGDKVINP